MRFLIVLAFALAACTPTQEEAAPQVSVGPQTVSVVVSSTSDAEAARQCGSPARPETVHHESNVITYRCLRGTN